MAKISSVEIIGSKIMEPNSCIKQLADRDPYLDINSVGSISIDGAGNGAIFCLLKHSDFYKVGVAFSVWDPRLARQGGVYYGLIASG